MDLMSPALISVDDISPKNPPTSKKIGTKKKKCRLKNCFEAKMDFLRKIEKIRLIFLWQIKLERFFGKDIMMAK